MNVVSLLDLPAEYMCNVGGITLFGLHPHSLYPFIEVHSLEVLDNKTYRIHVPQTNSLTKLLG